jgi:hypothetical protein
MLPARLGSAAVLALTAATVLARSASASLWASSPISVDLRLIAPAFRSDTPLATDADVVFLPWDNFYGVPWQTLLQGARPPVSWALRLSQTLQMALAWGKPVFLGLPLGSGPYRGCPAYNASDGIGYWPVVEPFAGCPSSGCYDWDPATNPEAASVRSAYVNFTVLMAATFRPAYLALGTDVNLYAEGCGGTNTPAFAALIDFSNQVYQAVKAEAPNMVVFPTVNLESVMQIRAGQECNGLGGGTAAPPPALTQCVNSSLAALAGLRRDAFAFSSYPHMAMAAAPGDANPAWQPWYWPVVLDALAPADAAAIIVAETGYISDLVQLNFDNGTTPLATEAGAAGAVGNDNDDHGGVMCGAVIDASHTDTEAWLAQVVKWAAQYGRPAGAPGAVRGGGMPLVTWYSAMDMLYSPGQGDTGSIASCPCHVPSQYQAYCDYLSAVRYHAPQDQGQVAAEFASKMKGGMGLRYSDGTKRQPLYDDWLVARGLPPNDDDQPVDDDGGRILRGRN